MQQGNTQCSWRQGGWVFHLVKRYCGTARDNRPTQMLRTVNFTFRREILIARLMEPYLGTY